MSHAPASGIQDRYCQRQGFRWVFPPAPSMYERVLTADRSAELAWLRSFEERLPLLTNREWVDPREFGGDSYEESVAMSLRGGSCDRSLTLLGFALQGAPPSVSRAHEGGGRQQVPLQGVQQALQRAQVRGEASRHQALQQAGPFARQGTSRVACRLRSRQIELTLPLGHPPAAQVLQQLRPRPLPPPPLGPLGQLHRLLPPRATHRQRHAQRSPRRRRRWRFVVSVSTRQRRTFPLRQDWRSFARGSRDAQW